MKLYLVSEIWGPGRTVEHIVDSATFIWYFCDGCVCHRGCVRRVERPQSYDHSQLSVEEVIEKVMGDMPELSSHLCTHREDSQPFLGFILPCKSGFRLPCKQDRGDLSSAPKIRAAGGQTMHEARSKCLTLTWVPLKGAALQLRPCLGASELRNKQRQVLCFLK